MLPFSYGRFDLFFRHKTPLPHFLHVHRDVLQDMAGSLASVLSGAAVEAEQACFLPMSSDGLPVIGK
jgi:glycine/D-amino acid oxidase-like deaminating enzyme